MIGVIKKAKDAMLGLAAADALGDVLPDGKGTPKGTPKTSPKIGKGVGGFLGAIGLGLAWDRFSESDLMTGRTASPIATGETDLSKQFGAMPTIWDSINELKKMATPATIPDNGTL
jgi:hypothetical protein